METLTLQELINKLRNSIAENSINPELLGKILQWLYDFDVNLGEVYQTTEAPLNSFGKDKSFCYDTEANILYLKLSGVWIPLIANGEGIALAQELGQSVTLGMSQKAITDALKALEEKLTATTEIINPFSVSLSTPQTIFPAGSVVNIVMSWGYNKAISKQWFNGEELDVDIRSKTINNVSANYIFEIKATTDDEKETKTKRLSVSFVNPFYYGNSMLPMTSVVIKSMIASATDSLNVDNLSGKTIKWGAFESSKMVIALPNGKTIARILDPNKFDIFPNFTMEVVAVNGIDYNVYVFNDETDANGLYTIILN